MHYLPSYPLLQEGFTPLAVALQQGHDKVVCSLLENDSRERVRLPALHIAAKKNDLQAANLLLEHERSANSTSKVRAHLHHYYYHYYYHHYHRCLYLLLPDTNELITHLCTQESLVNHTTQVTFMHVQCTHTHTHTYTYIHTLFNATSLPLLHLVQAPRYHHPPSSVHCTVIYTAICTANPRPPALHSYTIYHYSISSHFCFYIFIF